MQTQTCICMCVCLDVLVYACMCVHACMCGYGCLCTMQANIMDALSQAASGHPAAVPNAYESCKLRANLSVTTRAGNTITAEQVFRNIDGLVQNAERTVHLEVCAQTSHMCRRRRICLQHKFSLAAYLTSCLCTKLAKESAL